MTHTVHHSTRTPHLFRRTRHPLPHGRMRFGALGPRKETETRLIIHLYPRDPLSGKVRKPVVPERMCVAGEGTYHVPWPVGR